MLKRISFLGSIFTLIILVRCGLFEPEPTKGSLRIILVQEKTGKNLVKAKETLGTVQCIVKKGTDTIYNRNLTKQGDSFHGEITELEPGTDYSVLLYGKNSGSDIISRGYQAGISVSAGNETTVNMLWSAFAPVLESPANGSTTTDNTPSFEWNRVTDAVAYELVAGKSSGFGSLEIHKTYLTSTSYTATSALADGKYYWRVRCRDNQENWGSWSSTWNFTLDTQGPGAPTLLSPTGVIKDNTPTFQWSDVGDAVAYELKVYDNSGTIEVSIIVTDTTYTSSNPLPNGIHYWRVRCKNISDNWGEWSNIVWFTIETQGPSPPILDSPENGSTISDNTLSFNWSDVSNAVKYEIIVDNSSGFGSPEIHKTDLTSSSYTAASALADGKYYWKVRCMDNQDNWGSWSSTWYFTIDTQGPSAPTLISPENGSTIEDNTPSFNWSDVINAVKYEIKVDNSSEFGSPEIHKNYLTSSSYTATEALENNTYYWKVRARNSQESWGSWSDVWSFKITSATVETPTFEPPPGTYTTAQDVNINCETSGATIHYTTNGSDPTESDPSISNGSTVHISSTTTLKARAYKIGWMPSNIASGTYIILYQSETIIIDHTCTDLSQIPAEWIDAVQVNCRLHYAHTSHGEQLMTGLEVIENADAAYSFARELYSLPNQPGAFSIFDGQEDEDYITPDLYWQTTDGLNRTCNVLNHNPTINYSMWAWCTQLDYFSEGEVQAYLDAMTQLESEFPDVTFIYMTGNAQATEWDGYNRYLRNQQIRQYCANYGKVLFEFADLDSWWFNPNSNQWEQATYDYDGSTVPTEHSQFYGDEAGHTTYESCEQKGRAIWWMMARLIGWDGVTN